MFLTSHKWLPSAPAVAPQNPCRAAAEHAEYIFKIADCGHELLQAYGLLHREYVHAGYVHEKPSGLLFTKHHLLPQTRVLIATCSDNVVSTATIVRDTQTFGLPMDELYAPELSTLRRQGRKILEVSSLASDRYGFSRSGIQDFTKLIFLFCVFLAADDICIMVNPKHAPLYRSRCGFEVFGPEKYYSRVNAPAIALRSDVQALRKTLRCKGMLGSYPLTFISALNSRNIGLCPNIDSVLRQARPQPMPANPLDSNLLNFLASYESELLQSLPDPCRELLHRHYPEAVF